jgi:hypothetical protein
LRRSTGSSATKVTGGSGALVANRAVVAKGCTRQATGLHLVYQGKYRSYKGF